MFRRIFRWLRAARRAAATLRSGPPQVTEVVVLTTHCHPNARGRRRGRDERDWVFQTRLDSGQELHLRMGRQAREALLYMMLQEHVEDAAEMMDRHVPLDLFRRPG